MPEQQLEIEQNGEYKNINLIPKYKWDKSKKQFVIENGQKVLVKDGLQPDNFIVVEKQFVDGQLVKGNFGDSYSCKVIYAGEENVSFWLKPYQHEQFAQCGGVGDKVKITYVKEMKIDPKTGQERAYDNLVFSKV